MNPFELLRDWFLNQRRALPWRITNTPYAVLVSEIMLQQTQVSVVIPYYLRWMEKFPTFEALAKASEEEVLKYWEGLGYYSRARNLKKAAQMIVTEWNGEISEKNLNKIPGIGPYTEGAIRAFAFKQKAAAVDGNVMRVLSRYFALHEDICKFKGQKALRAIAETILPEHEPWVISEALIELGALICKKKPICSDCPLKSSCKAYLSNLTETLPIKSIKIASTKLYRVVTIFRYKGQFLIRQVPTGEVMAGLHEFPYFETDGEKIDLEPLKERIKETFSIHTIPIQYYPKVHHGFTRYRAHLTPILLECQNISTPEGYFWAPLSQLKELPFSSGHKKILNSF